ncbi:hypothetical protein F5B17DRAFT_176568 [Nemania serpens]|nr:hypothetical protein F5B17DRAFT_176568 [Nemania serpens]
MTLTSSSHFHDFVGYDDIAYRSDDPDNNNRLSKVDVVIRDMFRSTQKEASRTAAFHDHPVVLMVVNFMQKAHTWSWREAPVHRTIFPGLRQDGSPSQFDIEGVRDDVFRGPGTFGLLAKSFYNRCPDYSGRYNDGKFNSAIWQLNSYFNTYATCLFAEYLRHAHRLSPSHDYVVQYRKLLVSKAYRSLKNAQDATGAWPNPDMEIYLHFVKLLACGASTAEISSIYASLTSGPYALSSGTFPSITPDCWKSYRGWLLHNCLDWSDLHAQNLQDAWWPSPMWGPSSPAWLVVCFASWYDYWKPPSGSCFSADSHVAMADGSLVEISRVRAGDSVRSRTLRLGGHGTIPGTARVAFVSGPRRAGRSLYWYRDAPNVRFTETHPIVGTGGDSGWGADVALKFVDPDMACAVNMSWYSAPSVQIPPKLLDCHKGESSDPDEILYDLVLEPVPSNVFGPDSGTGVATFFMHDKAGGQLEVASEALVFGWFPDLMIFFQALLRGLIQADADVSSVTASLLDPNVIIKVPWRDMAEKIGFANLVSPTSQIVTERDHFSLAILFELLADDSCAHKVSPQAIADAFESLHSMLGRRIDQEVSIGWAYHKPLTPPIPISQSEDDAAFVHVLILHSLHFGGLTVPPTTEGAPQRGSLRVHISQDQEEILTRDVEWRRRGWQTLECHYPIDISDLVADTDDNGQKTWSAVGFGFHDLSSGTMYRGESLLCEEAVELVSLGSTAESNRYATLDVRVMRVARDTLRRAASWNADNRAASAEALGLSLADVLIKQAQPSSGRFLGIKAAEALRALCAREDGRT